MTVATGGATGDGIRLLRTVNDSVNGDYTLQTAELTDSGTGIGLGLGNNAELYLAVQDTGSTVETAQISDGDIFSVSGSDGTITASSESISVEQGDEVQFEISENEIQLTNQDTGSSLSVDPFVDDNIIDDGANGIILENSEVTLELDLNGISSSAFEPGSVPDGTSSNNFYLVNGEYDSGGGGVSEINVIAIKGSGADQINLEASTVTTIGPSGTNTLTYGGTSASQGDTFGVQAVQNEDDSLPVMTDADRFEIIIDPGTLETGETITLELTTESGATTEIRVSVPNTLSGETAVQV